MAEEKSNNVKKDIIENIKEKASEFLEDTTDALNFAKDKIDESLCDENIEKAKKKTAAFAVETKEALEELTENASELMDEAAEHLADFTEEAKEVTEKSKSFFHKVFKK